MGTFGAWSAYGSCGRKLRIAFLLASLGSTIYCISCIIYGGWLASSRGQYAELLAPSLYVDVARILAVVSTLAILNHLCCIYSVKKEMRCGIYSSAVASVIIFIMLLIGGIMGFVFRSQLIHQIPLNLKMLTSLRELYGSSDMDKITKSWDHLQSNFQCCGVNGTDDLRVWRTSKWHMRLTNKTIQLPESCCTSVNVEACKVSDLRNPDPSLVWTDTCYLPLQNDLLHVVNVAAWLSIVASLVQAVPAVLASWYAKLIRK